MRAVDFKLRGQLAVSLREIAGLDTPGRRRFPLYTAIRRGRMHPP